MMYQSRCKFLFYSRWRLC